MTPAERCEYLVKELGYESAYLHIRWALDNAEKQENKKYWEETLMEYSKKLSSHC